MSFVVINEADGLIGRHYDELTKEEIASIFQMALVTDDRELTALMVEELIAPEKDTRAIVRKYQAICDERPQWVKQMENILVSLELYRMQEERALNRLEDILGAYGIKVTEEEIRTMDSKEIKERIKKEAVI